MVSWLALSAAWTISHERALDSLMQILLLMALALVAVAGATREGAQWAARFVVIWGGFVTAYIVQAHFTKANLTGYGTELTEIYLNLSTVVGSATVLSSLMLLHERRGAGFWGLGAIVNGVGLSLGLGRGSLLFAGLVILGGVIALAATRNSVQTKISRKRLRRRKIAAGFCGMLLVTGIVWGALQVERTAERLATLISGRELGEVGRGELWNNTLRGIADAPFIGTGVGSHGIIADRDKNGYPHNFALQLLADGGLVGLSIAVVWLGCPFFALRQVRLMSDGLFIAWFGVYVFFVLEYSKSYDFYGSRALVVAGAVAISVAALKPEPQERRQLVTEPNDTTKTKAAAAPAGARLIRT